jgi:anti-anti-sigma factor
MTITATEHAAEVCVPIWGDITVRNSADIVESVVADWEKHGRPGRLILDLSGTRRIDSSGVGALMDIRRRVSEAGTRVVLSGVEEGPRRVLDRTGIARMFEIDDSPARRPVPMRKRPPRRALWAMVWLCVLVGGLAGIGVAAYPSLQRAHAQLEQVPVLGTVMSAMDQRVGEMEKSFKDQFSGLETRLTAHIRGERRQQAEFAKRTAKLESRINDLETAQRGTGARIDELQQKLEQQNLKEDK